jgi:GH15 family glucan-1,4-alpha-glucosidase
MPSEAVSPPERYAPIDDYAVIGDGRSAALVSASGSIDWWCLPRFDGDPVFGRLLDADAGGSFVIRPREPFRVERRYLEGTVVLATDFITSGGRARLVDFMPALPEAAKRTHPVPHRSIVRRVVGLRGSVRLEVLLRPRPRYGARAPRVCRRPRGHFALEWDDKVLYVVTQLALQPADGFLTGTHEIQAGERIDVALAYSTEAPGDILPLAALDAVQELTEAYWRGWCSNCAYQGPHREAVLRSVLTLKLLAYAPSGAIVAAPTTSLPEEIGGVRNWDYRYCWLRDAAATVRALLRLGYRTEAHAFAEWLLYLTRLTRPRIQVAYTVFGEPRLAEREVSHLEGYRASRPVRVGNAATAQFQLDVYGEVLDALALYQRSGGRFDRDASRLVRGLCEVILERWQEPDEGIWELRDGRGQRIHSKVMAWLGLERALEIAPALRTRLPTERIARGRDQIRSWVLTHGWDQARGAFSSVPGDPRLDAALLQLPTTGFLPARDPRVLGTIDAVVRQLARDDLVFRYRHPDGLPGREGAFLVCSFWLVEALALAGRADEAHGLFERLMERRNDLGLLAEEVDPETGAALGNFPQGLSHLGLVNAALTLEEAVSRSQRSAAQR